MEAAFVCCAWITGYSEATREWSSVRIGDHPSGTRLAGCLHPSESRSAGTRVSAWADRPTIAVGIVRWHRHIERRTAIAARRDCSALRDVGSIYFFSVRSNVKGSVIPDPDQVAENLSVVDFVFVLVQV